VFISWENESFLSLKEFGADKLEIVTPSITILAEPPVAVVVKNARKHGSEDVARAYLDYLYSDEGQEIAGRNFYRPRSEKAATKYSNIFPKANVFTIDEVFGGWQNAQKKFFNEAGVFDRIFEPGR
jgi:sulfate transport system substrate-binding protein